MTCHTPKPHSQSGRTPTDIVTYRYNGELVYVPVAPNYIVSPNSSQARHPRRLTRHIRGSSKHSRMHAKRFRSSRSYTTRRSRCPSSANDNSWASVHRCGPNSSRICHAIKSSTSTSCRRTSVTAQYRYRISSSPMQMRTTWRERTLRLRIVNRTT